MTVLGVRLDEPLQVLDDVRTPLREVGEGPGEQIVMSERRESGERVKIGTTSQRRDWMPRI